VRALADDWLRTVIAAGARGDLAGAGSGLLARWAEPHRRYHDLAHLSTVLDRVEQLESEGVRTSDAVAVRLAAWLHDAVYDPTAGDNEERSADLAAETLRQLRVPPALVDEVVRLVLLTRNHDPVPDDVSGAVLSDADLAVLAGPREAYDNYAEAIRAEYGHLDDATFAAGRAAVLRTLLGRDWVFATGYARATWEQPARQLMRAELARLGS